MHRNAQCVGGLGDAEVEFRRVDEHHRVGPARGQLRLDAAQHAEDARQVAQHLCNAHHGQVFHPQNGILPGFAQVRAAHADAAQRRVAAAQGLQQATAVHVAGKFTGVDPHGARRGAKGCARRCASRCSGRGARLGGGRCGNGCGSFGNVRAGLGGVRHALPPTRPCLRSSRYWRGRSSWSATAWAAAGRTAGSAASPPPWRRSAAPTGCRQGGRR
ncbi:hypothetical protein DSECCO2_593530 [anaerobic digester metagenome]